MDDYTYITEIVSKILKIKDKINMSTDLVVTYGMDSMQRVEIVIELEKKFDIAIPDEEAAKMRTVQNIFDFIKTKNG